MEKKQENYKSGITETKVVSSFKRQGSDQLRCENIKDRLSLAAQKKPKQVQFS